MEADPLEIAREAVALAEKATKGRWFWNHVGDDLNVDAEHGPPYYGTRGILNAHEGYDGDNLFADGTLCAHAGTHYGTVARALLAKHAEVGRLREALMVLEDNAGDMAERAGSSADAAAFRCLVEIARAALAQEAGK